MTSPAVDPGPGLAPDEAARVLARDGRNELPRPPPPSLAARAVRHLADPVSLLLLAAGVVSVVLLGELPEGLAILTIVAVNVAIGTSQEARADRAVAALRALAAPTAKVRRGGVTVRIAAAGVVVGDVVEVASGDRVPADLRLVVASGLAVDESPLTGEAIPADKRAGGAGGADVPVADRDGELFSGTLVVRGSGIGTVQRTGARTEVGRIAGSLQARPRAPLERELARVAGRIGIIALALGAVVTLIGLTRLGRGDTTVLDLVLVGLALAIAVVPESLAAAVTTALALAAQRMAGLGVIVRQLAAIETLGATTVIASDKTGTLTTGRLRVVETVTAAGREGALWRAALWCNDARDDVGDAVDVALRMAAERHGARTPPGHRVAEQPFDTSTRHMAVVHPTGAGPLLTVKGAPEVVLGRCVPGPETTRLAGCVPRLAARGLRVLALADREAGRLDARDLRPLGLLALRDEVRDSAGPAVADCRAAGIRVVMVTGDHPDTARAVAAEAGIDADPVVTGSGLPDGDERARALREAGVVARVDPSTKLALVRAHRHNGEVIAMTGDGINDAPALRNADVGVAVAGEEGTDVAREAADVVVTNGELGTIVAGVREGRRLYHNVTSMISYLLAGNLTTVAVILVGFLAWPELAVPLLPVQILWINLVMDGVPAIALGVDRAPGDPLTEAPRRSDARLLAGGMLARLASRAAALALLVLAAAWFARQQGWEAEQVRTQIVLTLVLTRLMLAYVSRARRWTFEQGWWRSRAVRSAVAVTLALQSLVVLVPVLGAPLALVPVPWTGWVCAAVAAALVPVLCDLLRLAEGRPSARGAGGGRGPAVPVR